MILDLDRTPAGQSDLSVSGRFNLDLGPERPSEVQVSGDLLVDNLESRCVLRGELIAVAVTQCGRCLGDFTLTYPVAVELLVLRDADSEEGDSSTPVLHQREGQVDLTEPLREAAVLSVPQARVCREDCSGLCVQCGADLNKGDCGCEDENIDPRWDGLPDLE